MFLKSNRSRSPQGSPSPTQGPSRGLNRRQFLQSGFVATAPLFAPRLCSGASPNETLNLASVGVGGKGWSDLNNSASGRNVRIVALCDVDNSFLLKASAQFPKAKKLERYLLKQQDPYLN